LVWCFYAVIDDSLGGASLAVTIQTLSYSFLGVMISTNPIVSLVIASVFLIWSLSLCIKALHVFATGDLGNKQSSSDKAWLMGVMWRLLRAMPEQRQAAFSAVKQKIAPQSKCSALTSTSFSMALVGAVSQANSNDSDANVGPVRLRK
jgi:hypothetical protein